MVEKKIKNNKNTKKLIAVVVVILLISTVLIYGLITFLDQREEIKETKSAFPITQLLTKTYAQLEREDLLDQIDIVDDQISPLTPQGLSFEVNRIRHRGFLDTIMNGGTAWRQKPEFYYTLEIDGFTHYSQDINAPSGYEEIPFNSWDTIFEETKRVQSAKNDEQETSDIILTIFEKQSSGLLGLKTADVEIEKIKLTYCYRTGRWTGDNYFGHPDGYGNYLGENYEVWFDIYQTSYARDKIPYWVKVNILDLDPMVDYTYKDLDGDGIPVAWEWRWGYDPFTWDDHANLDSDIDGLSNLDEYQMRKYFADPFKPNIYIEADGMKRSGLFGSAFLKDHIFYDESTYIMSELFAQQGINIYIDNGWPGTPSNAGGELLDHVISIDQDSGMQLRYYRHHFPDERKGIFRYFIASDGGGHNYPSELNRFDTMVVGTNLKRVLTSRQAFTPRTKILTFTSLAMHELGHSLGLSLWTFGGVDNYTIYPQGILDTFSARRNYAKIWGGYESCMNYYYATDAEVISYSDGINGPPYDQNDWQHIYLPTFKMEGTAVEDPTLYYDDDFNELPGMEVMRKASELQKDLDVPPISSRDYTYDENLTLEYMDQLKELVFVHTTNYDVRVYIDRNNSNKDYNDYRNVRVYAKPDLGPTHYSEWSLIAEGNLDNSELVIAHALWNK